LGQPVCTPRHYVVYVIYFTHFVNTVVWRFMSVLVCSAYLDKMFSKLVMDSCIILISIVTCRRVHVTK
jgi:hypothetical protein